MDPVLIRDAADHGLTPRILYGQRWARPVAGVAIPVASSDNLADRCRAALAVLPDGAVITHLSSAALRGWWLPRLDDGIPVIAGTDAAGVHLARRGVYVRRCGIPSAHRVVMDGVPCASPAWTIVELAEDLTLLDLVVAIDSALHAKDVTVADVRAALVPRRRGVRTLRRALDLCDGRSESPWETVLRLLHVLSGVDVEPQVRILDETGAVVARGDLGIKGTRRIAEYDGADHRRRDQHERDLAREKRLARRGYERYGYTASEILREPGRIIRDADEARGVVHRPQRLASWFDIVAESTLTARGRDRLRRRLARFDRRLSPRSSRTRSPNGANTDPTGADRT